MCVRLCVYILYVCMIFFHRQLGDLPLGKSFGWRCTHTAQYRPRNVSGAIHSTVASQRVQDPSGSAGRSFLVGGNLFLPNDRVTPK